MLADGPVPVTELRAAVIIGSGSASFEMLRHLTDVLPAMVTPRWVRTRCQPIAIRDVLAYLVGVLGRPEHARGRVLEIGGPDVVTYEEMMQLYAEVAGLRPRVVIPVPVLTPRLSSYWVGLVTPLPVGLARPLIDSLENEVVVHDDAITAIVPRQCLTLRRAIELALARTRDLEVTTSWAEAELVGPQPGRSDAVRPALVGRHRARRHADRPHRRADRRRVRGGVQHRRRAWVAGGRTAVGAARLRRPRCSAGRECGAAGATPTELRVGDARRLLPGRGDGARAAGAAPGRDEGAG